MKRLGIVVVVLAVAGGLWFLLGRSSGRGVGASGPAPLAPAVRERAPEPLAPAASAREELPGASAESAPGATPRPDAAPAARTRVVVHGRVFDARGQELGGVPLVVLAGGFDEGFGELLGKLAPLARAQSDPAGRFELELELERRGARLECALDSAFVTLRAARLTLDNAAREQVVVAAPVIELGGTVAAAGGGPLAGASLRLVTALEAFAGFPVPLDGTVAASIEVNSGADGRFTLARAPAVAGASLVVQHRLFRTLTLPSPEVTTLDLWLELEPRKSGEPWLQGVVVRADGSPASGARVRLGSLSAKTAADGRFAFEQVWMDEETPLVAALEGFQPAIAPASGALMQGEYPPPFQRLVLGGPALTIRGQVLDAEGKPCRGWQVSLRDGTALQRDQVPFDLAEDLARGKNKKVATKSDREGRFELGGLLTRDYVVQAYDEDDLLMLRSPPTPAGTQDLVLRVPADAFQRLAGVVVARDGTPLADVRVDPILVTASCGGASSWDHGEGVSTDASGRFALARIPRRYVELQVNGEGVMPQTFELDEARAGQELRLAVARRCHLRVELASAAGAEAPESITALDADGAALSLNTFEGNGWSSSTYAHLAKLGTHPLAVSEDARTLVFWRGEEELSRVPLALVPGEVAVVQAPGGGR